MVNIALRAAQAQLLLAILASAAFAEPAASGTAPAPGQKPVQKYDLQYKFRKGESVRSEVVHRAIVDSSIQGTNQTAETRTTSIKCWRISDVNLVGQITLINSVESIDMWQRMKGRQEVRFNSLTDQKPPAGYEDAAKAVGIPLSEVTMDTRGRILHRLEKHAQPQNQSTQIAVPLPAGPIAIGEQWTQPLDVEVVMPGGAGRTIKTQQKLTLEKVADGVATIQIESQVLTPIRDPAVEAQLIQRLANGSVKFDIDAGRVVSQQMDLDRRVIGFSGPSSSMHYVTRFTEQLLPPAPETARALPPAGSSSRKKGESTR